MNNLKSLGTLVVISALLGVYSMASADDLDTRVRQADEAEMVAEVMAERAEAEEIADANCEQIADKLSEPEWESLGEFTITAYCPCEICCGQWADGITADGSTAVEGVTIAASSEFEFGTVLRIDGHEYVVQDRGGAITGNRLDIFFDNHSDALEWGVQTKEVEVKQ